MTPMRDLLVVIPMKDPARAKTRLMPHLDNDRRERLVIQLFSQMLRRLQALRHGPFPRMDIATITCSPRIARLATALGASVIDERGCVGLTSAAEQAASHAAAQGYRRLCLFPGDIADPCPADLSLFLSQQVGEGLPGVVICPSVDGGTNGFMLPMPLAGHLFAYGPQSCDRHAEAAMQLGLSPRILAVRGLMQDVDLIEDVPPGLWQPASRHPSMEALR